ncbi:urokinase plasminogen activator surface receptor-like isoform X2 [Lepisosteus oculatus]|uniref:urokinase plasminogen activator surface receptor-like isoform X2 n=1 Tax=Lepisosteus oculatus TaxID=7918 RepID=UPI00371B7446
MLFLRLYLIKVASLKCFKSAYGSPETQEQCQDSETTCAAETVRVTTGGNTQDVTVKRCSKPQGCGQSVSINYGTSRTAINSTCCSTDLCNTVAPPAYGDSAPSGLECFTCEGQDCTKTLQCLWVEDRCMESSAKVGEQKLVLKGCVSRNACIGEGSEQLSQYLSVGYSCCQGNLCNSAKRVAQNIFLLLLPLVSVRFLF